MKKTEIYKYYAFGFNFAAMKGGLRNYGIDNANRHFIKFFDNLKELELPVTIKIAEELKKVQEALKSSSEKVVPEIISNKIAIEVKKIEPALDAELHLAEIYVLTKKRYPLQVLLKSPNELLGAGVFSSLSETAKKDFGFACTQIALGQSTAAAFHLMRTLEEQVKMLYFAYKKTKRMEKLMWGPMIVQLREKRAPKPSEKLLNHLDGIRVHFRNPTQHPDMFYSLDDAQDLLNQTITAINMIFAEIPQKS